MLITWAAWIFFLFQIPCFAQRPAPSLNIAGITLDDDYHFTLENQTKAIGLQDALNGLYGSTNGTITVFTDACMQRDGTPNCTAACLDTTQMFSNLETLHNCAVFPNISVHLANNALTPAARRLAEDLNIRPSSDDSSLPSRVSNAIQRCLVDSCNNNEDCASTLNPINGSNRKYSSYDLTGTRFINNTYFPLCAPIPAKINADVGGVGVWSKAVYPFHTC